MIRIVVVLLLIVSCTCVQAEVYKYYDKNGQVHFSDRPTAKNKSQRIKVPRINSVKAPAVTYQKRKNTTATNQEIIMYSAAWCGVCKKAKKYFHARRLSFTEYDIDKNRKAQIEFIRLGGKGVPLILVGDYKMAGFDQGFFDRMGSR